MQQGWRRLLWLFLGAAVFALLVLFLVQQRSLRPIPGTARVSIRDNIVGIYTGQSYAYLIFSDEKSGVTLIDAGSDSQGVALLAELAQHNMTPDDVKTILLTHGHRDHIAAAHLFPKAIVYVGDADAALVWGDAQPRAPLVKMLMRFSKKPPRPAHLRRVLSGTRLSIGTSSITAIAAPGHTAGSMVYQYDDILFSGDAVLAGSPLRLVPWYFTDAPHSAAQSMKRIETLSFRTLADGHSGVSHVSIDLPSLPAQ